MEASRALLHEQWEAGGSPRLEVRSHIQREQARYSLTDQTRLMQLVGERSCGVHSKETHPTPDCILHALQCELCSSIHTVCRLGHLLIGGLLRVDSH